MNEELNPNVESQQENVGANTDYIEAIKEMKEKLNKSVSMEDYMKLKQENKKLLNAYMDGQELETKKAEPVDIAALKKRMATADLSLDGITAALELRKAVMDQGYEDPFYPTGKKVVLTEEDKATAQRVAAGFAHCVEYADGDPHVFANELARITVDTGPAPRRKKK